jgi:hypothetical protein
MLEHVRACFKVIRHVRPKLSCDACDRIVQAPAPSRPIDRGLEDPGLLAHVLVSKYADTSRSIDGRRSTPAKARSGPLDAQSSSGEHFGYYGPYGSELISDMPLQNGILQTFPTEGV